jgi:hypothetical protein
MVLNGRRLPSISFTINFTTAHQFAAAAAEAHRWLYRHHPIYGECRVVRRFHTGPVRE